MLMLENFWITEGSDEHDIDCPPSGGLVKANYPNGDRLKVEFRSFDSWDAFDKRYPLPKLPESVRRRSEELGAPDQGPALPSNRERAQERGFRLPLSVVEIEMTVAGTELKLGARKSQFGGLTISGGWISGGQVGVQLD